MDNGELTPQDLDFCRRVAMGENKTRAYKAAGFADTPNKVRYASQNAYDLARKPYISKRIDTIKAEMAKADKMAVEKMTEKAAAVDWDVLAFYATEGQNPENSMKDRLHCADSYAKIKGLWVNKVETSGDFVIDVVIDDE